MRAIQQQVAQMAGVSVTTVSLVLNNKGNISEATRQRVLAAVKACGYKRRSGGGNLALIHSSKDQPLLPQLHQAAAELGYAITSFYCSRDCEEPPPLSARKKVSGILCYGGVWKDVFLQRLCETHPVVLLGASVPNEDVDSVWVDSLGGIEGAVRSLITRGHRRLGLINGPKTSVTSGEKELGFRRALASTGPHVHGTVVEAEIFDRARGCSAARRMLDLDPLITAVLAGETTFGLAAYEVCRERGLRIGSDLSVIVFHDDTGLMELSPRPSAISLPKLELARAAVQQLAQRIDAPLRVGRRVLLKPRLIERESIANLAASTAPLAAVHEAALAGATTPPAGPPASELIDPSSRR